ncbi:MAG: hypothetical protein M1312_00715 [Patescibacteria group bacterium]|nr:hypothetical protein [Patescibacteria group bacterium]
MPKLTKSKGDNQNIEIRRLGVIVEEINDNVKLIAEQYGDISEKLDSHTKILDSHTEILDSHTKILDSHTRILDSHTEMIGHIVADLEITKDDVSLIKNELRQKVGIEEFVILEKRVAALEKHIGRR